MEPDLIVTQTERLILRRLTADDATFVFELVNDPDWLRYIGDKGVRNLDDARNYIDKGPVDMYRRLGFGLYRVERKGDGAPIGMCGLIKRDMLDDVDIGFAFLPQFRAQGYASEAARATLQHGRDAIGLKRVVAIVSPDNAASGRLLERVGLRFECMFDIPGEDRQVRFYGCSFDGAGA